MHTTVGKTWAVFHNGDWSGEATFRTKYGEITMRASDFLEMCRACLDDAGESAPGWNDADSK